MSVVVIVGIVYMPSSID